MLLRVRLDSIDKKRPAAKNAKKLLPRHQAAVEGKGMKISWENGVKSK
jgi:hypothetical protein